MQEPRKLSLVTSLQGGRPKNRISILGGRKVMFYYPKPSNSLWCSSTHLFQAYKELFILGRGGRKVKLTVHLQPVSKLKWVERYLHSPIRLHGMHRENIFYAISRAGQFVRSAASCKHNYNEFRHSDFKTFLFMAHYEIYHTFLHNIFVQILYWSQPQNFHVTRFELLWQHGIKSRCTSVELHTTG